MRRGEARKHDAPLEPVLATWLKGFEGLLGDLLVTKHSASA